MKKVLQINTVANTGSTGKIAEQIGTEAIRHGWESWIAFSRSNPESKSKLIRVGNKFDMYLHGLSTRILDNHGLCSKRVTRQFVEHIKEINPDIIHLHNIHGYYLNFPLLADYLKHSGKQIVWTLHDCWAFTGHCSHFLYADCNRWKTDCHNCPELRSYPTSWLVDNSRNNHRIKKNAFIPLAERLTIVPVSEWLGGIVRQSFLRDARIEVIRNGIDIRKFKPMPYDPKSEKSVLGVSNVWTGRKGLFDFIKLRNILPANIKIKLIGLTKRQIEKLPDGIEGIMRTESCEELAKEYSMADVFVNPSWEESLSLTAIEAQACGTPVVCYNTGGTPETINSSTGKLVNTGDIDGLKNAIIETISMPKSHYQKICRLWTEENFDCANRFIDYVRLYEELLKN